MNMIQYKFIKMDLTQFSPDWDRYNTEIQSIGIGSNFQFSLNREKNIIRCITTLSFSQNDQVFLKSELQTFYEIKKESIDEMTKEGEIVVARGLLCQFASLAYGSFRGVLYMKTINTPLNNLIIPPLYLDEVIKDDMKFLIQ